jgi:glycosyltransferase involved in cell wall biosynthesis
MLVSVVMPVHGSAPFFEEAVESVRNQDFPDWELLLILDRPDDELQMRARKLSDIDSRVKVLESTGVGIVDALNFGLKKAMGELIARIDSDDKMKPNRLGIQTQFLKDNEEISCVGSQMIMIDVDDVVIGKTDYPRHHSEIQRHLMFQNCIGHPAVMYRKTEVMEIGGYRNALSGAEDYDLWFRLAKNSRIHNQEYSLTEYRVSDGQYSKTFGKRHTLLEDALRLDALFNFLEPFSNESINDTDLRRLLIRARMSNISRHPVLVMRSLEGLIVSSLLRNASRGKGKIVRLISSTPWIVLLFMLFPITFKSFLIKKLQLREEKKN